MLDGMSGSKTELLLFAVPSLIVMILSLLGVDERISKPTARRQRRNRFCEIGTDDQPVISDPGRAGTLPAHGPANAMGRRAFLVADDMES